MKPTRRDAFKLLGLPLALTAFHHRQGMAADALHADKVFTISNSTAGNELVVFAPDGNGGLARRTSASSDGAGSGGGLGSQGAVSLSGSGRYVFVVNAGSNTLATFLVSGLELRLASVVDSGGTRPISVAEREGIVVVLNDQGEGNIVAFRNDRGQLTQLGSRPLSASSGTAAAQVSFSADGDTLIVTEKGTHRLVTYRVGADGSLGAPLISRSAGLVPFGFGFDRRNRLFVSEAGAGTASSYRLNGPVPQLLSGPVATTQTAPCWVAVTPNGRYFYTANTGSRSISSFRIARDGTISLIAAQAGSVGDGSTPVDAAISAGGQRLFVLDRGNARVVVFDIDPDGALTAAGSGSGLPRSVVGLAAN
ncbi:MAG: beta-propeller fold lactonase family protein [Methylibium sp.]|uniref:lactonase family protein n=1 Tax=Methylibium sp. TaxID=2067992 RepID=UPI0017EF7F16|nr:beta-propeller fold lactonase family protein [Methylibium sp.]MBA3595985.1 beta-propeller fold lactonase family protein [Methylibium sp.]